MDFDEVINRQGQFSSKWDLYQGRDVIPLWVADMDFKCPQPVQDALSKRVEHGVFGYTRKPDGLIQVLLERLSAKYNWHVNAEDIVFIPGVVVGLNLACRAYTLEGQNVATAIPIYPPFLSAPVYSGREVVSCESEYSEERWKFPISGLNNILSENVGLFLLCNPYNPIGRVLTLEELQAITKSCMDKGVVICSDEIHCDLLFDGREHIPTATLGSDVAQNTITLMAPSKTFNIAGLGGAFAIIQNGDLRQKYSDQARGVTPHVNLLALEAMMAAYKDCEDWYQELLVYLQGNRDLLFKETGSMPGVKMNQVEATFLAWLDVRELGLDNPMDFFEKAGLGFSDGAQFGAPGYMRINFGCTRSLLIKAIERLDKAVRSR